MVSRCLPYYIKDRIEYDNPKTLEKAMRKANFCFEQDKKKEGIANWKAKKNSNQPEFKKKEFVPQKNFKIIEENGTNCETSARKFESSSGSAKEPSIFEKNS